MLVAVALLLVIHQRGGLFLPPLAIATVVLYTLGYFIRLAVMTRVSKSGDPASCDAISSRRSSSRCRCRWRALAALSASGLRVAGRRERCERVGLREGVEQSGDLPAGRYRLTLTIVSVFAAIILLDRRRTAIACRSNARPACSRASPRPSCCDWSGAAAPTGAEAGRRRAAAPRDRAALVAPRWDRKEKAARA